jgi:hypothetical protein
LLPTVSVQKNQVMPAKKNLSKPQAILVFANFRSLKIQKTFFRRRNTRQTIGIWFGLEPLSAE